MAYRLPPLGSFRVFEAAARHLSFKKAADELNVTPAAVSQQIKKLETYLGASLFVRAAPKLHLTDEGVAMLPKVSEALELFAMAVESTQQSMQKNASRALNVIAPPSFAVRWLVPRLARFSAAVPDLAIRISSNPENIDGPQTALALSRELIDPRDQTSEVSIRFGTGLYPGYQVDKLLTPDYVVVCSPGLVAGEPPLRTPQDLANHILIHDESISAIDKRPDWNEWLRLAGVGKLDTERGPRFSNSVLVIEAVLEGQGVGLVLKPQVQADIASGRLVMPFPVHMPSAYSYFLVAPKAIAGKASVLAFQEWLHAEISTHGV